VTPPEADPARDLMLAFQRGDDRAFDRLVESCKRDVFALAFRYGLDESRAEDIAQETFLRVWRARASYQPTARFHAWLLRIAANLVVSEARSKRRARAIPIAADEEGPSMPDPRVESPAAPAERAEVASRVEEALAELPDNQRIALVMNRFHDASYQEVAAALSLTVEAVKSLLFRARQNLKEALKDLADSTETSAPPERSKERRIDVELP
jgi:RNA polymerase sigma-70 factor (ECF subfamily)